MSYSSIYLIDDSFNGSVEFEYRNSWWFSPIIWDVLLDKYMRKEIQTPFGYKKSIIGSGAELSGKLNDIINNCESFSDRICWEMSNQQVFLTKDKNEISKAVREFAVNNKQYDLNDEGISTLTYEHIIERFEEIANDILEIDEEMYPYFVFKNTSVDDNVEYWFSKLNKEEDDYIEKSLSEWDKHVAEFVFIEGNKITGFASNLDYFNKR